MPLAILQSSMTHNILVHCLTNRKALAPVHYPGMPPTLQHVKQHTKANHSAGCPSSCLLCTCLQEGDVVDEFQPLCEVQSDKAAIEITSRCAALHGLQLLQLDMPVYARFYPLCGG